MMDLALRAIAEPRRRDILLLVLDAESSSGEIASHFDVTGPAISQHLKVLVDAGLVMVRRQGTRRMYRARPEGLVGLRQFLEQFWGERLQVLAEEAEAEQRRLDMANTGESEGIELEVRIAARPETVFSFFTDPVMMVRWMGIDATLDPRPGGVYRVSINGRDIANGRYIEVVPHARVVFSGGWEAEDNPVPSGSSTVEISLAEEGDGTVLTLRHSGLPEEQRGGHREGWDHFLVRLVTVAEGGDPGPDPWAGPEDSGS